MFMFKKITGRVHTVGLADLLLYDIRDINVSLFWVFLNPAGSAHPTIINSKSFSFLLNFFPWRHHIYSYYTHGGFRISGFVGERRSLSCGTVKLYIIYRKEIEVSPFYCWRSPHSLHPKKAMNIRAQKLKWKYGSSPENPSFSFTSF